MHLSTRLLALAFTIVSAVVPFVAHASSTRPDLTDFPIEKGVNLSHWLSQSTLQGEMRDRHVSEADFRAMAAIGLDHVRLPVDEEHLWSEDGRRDEAGFTLLHRAIDWSLKHQLRVIVDLHVLRAHHFNRSKTRTLWTDPMEQAKMVDMWAQLSRELRQYPIEKVAYEIMNEPATNNPADWNSLMNRAVAEIRKEEPRRVLVLGSHYGNQVKTFADLDIPRDDPNLILSFHYYAPLLVTHYKAPWSKSGGYTGPIAYPGQTVDPGEYENIKDPALLAAVKERNGFFNREVMNKEILTMVKLGEKLGLRIHCGEFGCYTQTPDAMRLQWYRDIMSIFREHHIAWAPWNWKADFPIMNADLTPKSAIVDILMDREVAPPAPSNGHAVVDSKPGELINPSE